MKKYEPSPSTCATTHNQRSRGTRNALTMFDPLVWKEIRYECNTEKLEKAIKSAIQQSDKQLDIFIRITGCYTNYCFIQIEKCLVAMDIEGQVDIDPQVGVFGIVIPSLPHQECTLFASDYCYFLYNGHGSVVVEKWCFPAEIRLPGITKSCRLNSTRTKVRRNYDAFGYCFEKFLYQFESLHRFPKSVFVYDCSRKKNSLENEVRTFTKGSYFMIETVFTINFCRNNKRIYVNVWGFTVKVLFQKLAHFSSEEIANNTRLCEVLIHILLFKLWIALRQTGDIISLLNCPRRDVDLRNLQHKFNRRCTPSQLCDLPLTNHFSATELYRFQVRFHDKKSRVSTEIENLTQILEELLTRLQPAGAFSDILTETYKKNVVDLLLRTPRNEWLKKLERASVARDIFNAVNTLSDADVSLVLDSMKPEVREIKNNQHNALPEVTPNRDLDIPINGLDFFSTSSSIKFPTQELANFYQVVMSSVTGDLETRPIIMNTPQTSAPQPTTVFPQFPPLQALNVSATNFHR